MEKPEQAVLDAVRRRPGIHLAELGRVTGLGGTTLLKLTAKLQGQGLIERHDYPRRAAFTADSGIRHPSAYMAHARAMLALLHERPMGNLRPLKRLLDGSMRQHRPVLDALIQDGLVQPPGDDEAVYRVTSQGQAYLTRP